ncbi:MAG: DNA adenine methylase [Tistlia sp.]|uniref:DNA adenine methylase n=1 Tax=Tistlia sp. TaxID=3057121 RepID=UPI0034A5C1D5
MPDHHALEPVLPIRPVAAYVGGKRNLAKRLTAILDETPCTTYAEPFVGMGGIFFRRSRRPKAEVVNDLSRDVANLFRLLQRHYQALVDMIRWQITTRAEFERLIATDPATLTDLERAARFLYLQRTAFGGKVAGRNFGVSPGSPASFDVSKVVPLLEAAHERLAGVLVECLPYEAFLARYDRPGTLFYLDPPYRGSEAVYGQPFAGADHERLAELLAGIQGRFLLSINATDETRRIFAGFEVEEVGVSYGLQGGGRAHHARELIVSGPGQWRSTPLPARAPAGGASTSRP